MALTKATNRMTTGAAANVLDFGAIGDGVADDTAAIQAALDASKYVYIPIGSYLISTQLVPQGSSIVEGAGRESHILLTDGDMNGFYVATDGVTIKHLKISCNTLTGTLGGVNGKAAIYLQSASQCTISDNFIFNIYNSGIRLYLCTSNTIENNKFGDWFTTSTANNDAANIKLIGSNSYNNIQGNKMLGANCPIGIFITDYYLAASFVIGNIVTNNNVANKTAYGIAHYVTTGVANPDGYDTRAIISNNNIDNISGAINSGQSGAGIYLLGADGALVSGNTIKNCCQDTTVWGGLAQGCIKASTQSHNSTGGAEISITNNNIHTSRGPAIWATSSTYFGIRMTGNVITSTDVDATATGYDTPVRIQNCNFSSFTGNTVIQPSLKAAVYVTTVTAVTSFLDVSSNYIKSSGSGIVFAYVTSGSFDNSVISNNRVRAVDYGIQTQATDNTTIANNKINTGAGYALYISTGINIRVSGNSCVSTSATYDVSFGEGVGGIIDNTNTYTEKVNHVGLGILEAYTSSGVPPIYGYYKVGDRVINRGAVVGNAKAWRCTTTGEPGTWTSEGNL
jgi:parallel beta-helix repeat protein